MKVPVNIVSDLTLGVSMHGYWAPALPTPPGSEQTSPPVPAIELPVNQGWPIGVGMGSVRKTSTVTHKAQPIISDQSDCGLLIPHLTVPIANLWLPIIPLTSRRKNMFSAGTVHMNGAAVAVASPAFFPMLSCGAPLSMPLTVPITNLANTLDVGVTLADIVGGVLNIASTMAIEALAARAGGGEGEEAADGALSKLLPDHFGAAIARAGLASLTGFATSGVQHAMDPSYPFKVSFEVPFRAGSVRVGGQFGSSDPNANPSQITIGGNVGVVPLRSAGGGSGSVRADGSVTYNFDGSKAGTTSARGQFSGAGQTAGARGAASNTEETP